MTERPSGGRPAGGAPRSGGAPGGRTRPGSASQLPARSDPSVYRRRRLLGLVVLMVLLGGLVGLVSLLVGAAQDGTPGGDVATPTRTPTPTAAPSATLGYVPVACADGTVVVEELTAQEAYRLGGSVGFTLTVENSGAVPCLLDGGSGALGVTVRSGDDRVWSSVDCPTEPAERMLLLDVGAAETVTITWDQRRSAPGCPEGQTSAQPGVYRASAVLEGDTAVVEPEWVFTVG